jgi:hypothetical protein
MIDPKTQLKISQLFEGLCCTSAMPHILADLGERQPSITLPETPYIPDFPEGLRPWSLKPSSENPHMPSPPQFRAPTNRL